MTTTAPILWEPLETFAPICYCIAGNQHDHPDALVTLLDDRIIVHHADGTLIDAISFGHPARPGSTKHAAQLPISVFAEHIGQLADTPAHGTIVITPSPDGHLIVDCTNQPGAPIRIPANLTPDLTRLVSEQAQMTLSPASAATIANAIMRHTANGTVLLSTGAVLIETPERTWAVYPLHEHTTPVFGAVWKVDPTMLAPALDFISLANEPSILRVTGLHGHPDATLTITNPELDPPVQLRPGYHEHHGHALACRFSPGLATVRGLVSNLMDPHGTHRLISAHRGGPWVYRSACRPLG